MSDNRRSATRHAVELAARVGIRGAQHEATIRNLSLGGASLGFQLRLAMGDRVQLRFQVATLEDPIEVTATVRWSTESGLGLQFDGLRAREVYALGKYFETL